MKITLLIPAFNEEQSLPFTLLPLITLKNLNQIERQKVQKDDEFDQDQKILSPLDPCQTEGEIESDYRQQCLSYTAHSISQESSSFPSWDELYALSRTLQTAKLYLDRICVINNASTDQTESVASALGAEVIYCSQKGYGNACLRGLDSLYENAPDAVVFMDADGADHPLDLDKVLLPLVLNQADLVIGSRVKYAQANSLTFLQKFGNALSCTLIRLCFAYSYTDLGPFRAIRWDALQTLQMQDPTFGWTVEMQAKAALKRLNIHEVHVRYRPRYAGESKISGQLKGSIKAGSKILWTIGKLKCL